MPFKEGSATIGIRPSTKEILSNFFEAQRQQFKSWDQALRWLIEQHDRMVGLLYNRMVDE